jgi:hypothetical protein
MEMGLPRERVLRAYLACGKSADDAALALLEAA